MEKKFYSPRKIFIGGMGNTERIGIGGDAPVTIQTMWKESIIDVKNDNEKLHQILIKINELKMLGCDIIRFAVPDMESAESFIEICKLSNIPLVADIHFDYRLALQAIESGVDKIRINPGNITNKEHVKLLVSKCKEKNIPIRIGVNGGSLPKGLENTPEDMIKAAKMHISILEELEFYDIVLSLKSTNIFTAIKAYELASKEFNYPLHIGITESGTEFSGTIKSSIGLGIILNMGIGNTIRVSLTDDPVKEIVVAKEILKNFGLITQARLISCPTCGRTQYDMIDIAKKMEIYLSNVKKDITVAIMGCIVNGPGEAKDADIGVAGGKGEALLFKKGVAIKKIKETEIYDTLVSEIEKM